MISLFLALTLTQTTAFADTPTITNAKAAELSLHRVERLVILKKVDPAYQSDFKGLSVVPIAHSDTASPAFHITLSQVGAADGSSKTLLIPLTQDGHPLQEVPGAGGAPANAPTWPDADPVTISEDALHYILDNNTTIPALVPFYNGLTSLSISPASDSSGQAVAIVEIHAGENDGVLKETMKASGDFVSFEVIPKN